MLAFLEINDPTYLNLLVWLGALALLVSRHTSVKIAGGCIALACILHAERAFDGGWNVPFALAVVTLIVLCVGLGLQYGKSKGKRNGAVGAKDKE